MSQPPEPIDPISSDEFATALAEVEQSLLALKDRYFQIQRDWQLKAQLSARQEEGQRSGQDSSQWQQELQQIQQQLEALELNLESSLFSWESLKKPFWLAVRFLGLGICLGWVLKSLAG